MDESSAELGDFNYIIVEIIGEYAYGYLKSEQGIHQLTRISPFDENSRIQSSFADVEVIPIIDESIDFEIPEQDLEIYLKPTPRNSNRQSVFLISKNIETRKI